MDAKTVPRRSSLVAINALMSSALNSISAGWPARLFCSKSASLPWHVDNLLVGTAEFRNGALALQRLTAFWPANNYHRTMPEWRCSPQYIPAKQAIASTIANTNRIRQPRPKQPRPFLGGGASTQVFIK